MNNFFLDLGFSWTLSKVLPYLIFLLLGVALFVVFRKNLRTGLPRVIFSLIIIVPVGIYFAVSPIYEGDFTNNFVKLTAVPDLPAISQNTLTVIAIPNCPYCAESVSRLNKIASRIEGSSVNFVVLSSDPDAMSDYRELASDQVVITNDTLFDKYESITGSRYPTFVYRNNDGVKVWSNDGFGVRAADWVESELLKVK